MELSRLTSEERTVPQLVEKLINYIEMHGLYTEGIYRKSGSTNKIKELRQGLDTGETELLQEMEEQGKPHFMPVLKDGLHYFKVS